MLPHLKQRAFGDATLRVCDTVKMTDLLIHLLKEEPDLFSRFKLDNVKFKPQYFIIVKIVKILYSLYEVLY
jgi:hypothetical protein